MSDQSTIDFARNLLLFHEVGLSFLAIWNFYLAGKETTLTKSAIRYVGGVLFLVMGWWPEMYFLYTHLLR
jgi:hypothetical protein